LLWSTIIYLVPPVLVDFHLIEIIVINLLLRVNLLDSTLVLLCLYLAEKHPFDVFITADKNLPYQQNLTDKNLKIIILNSRSTRPDHLVPLMKKISEMISSLSMGSSVFINDAGEIESVD